MRRWFALAVAALTVVQLAVGAFSGLQQYDGKGFGYRLLAYPVLMAVPPLLWAWRHRGDAPPWGAVALVWSPFLLDVTGNTLDLFDAVVWWDDLMHFISWGLLCGGLGLLLVPHLRPAWLQVLLVTGLGSLLAIGWELGEWWTFIRRGTELDGAYQDTLGDEALGTLGALLAGLGLAGWTGRQR
ncbi:hypothetical protein [Nocardioides currus]|uniref:DUF2238 domain-containing protein n=1 Tax=Nocardioides currus TaxID=2133958 RepID=A0A2R7YWF2_9ACTN|nr:hypothetical protein [Nocardioides currus]PUA80705.1 hypothetical protein C7S10_13225 [Nocardioides currus]